MYKNIGKKIKGFAVAIAIILSIVYIILGIVMLLSADSQSAAGNAGIIGGVITILLGPVLAWIGSWFLFGYGELVDKTASVKENTDYLVKMLDAHINSQNTTTENE